MTSGPNQKHSHLARDLGALLLVGASFMPHDAFAAESRPENTMDGPVPEQVVFPNPPSIELKHNTLPKAPRRSIEPRGMARSTSIKHSIASNLSSRTDIVGAIASKVEYVDEVYSALKIGMPFEVFGESSHLNGRLALTSQGGVRLSIEPKNAGTGPRVDLSVNPFDNGGSVALKVKLF